MHASVKLILYPQCHRWDDWVPQDRVRKLTDENKELAQNLKKEMDALRQRTAPKATATFTKKKAAGSDLSSTRGSEERNSSVPATGRGQKRGRDYEIEKVGNHSSSVPPSSTLSATSSSSLDSLSSLSLREDSITSTPTSSMFLPPHPNPTLLALQNPNLRRGRSRAQLWPGGYEADGTVPRTSRTPKPLPPAEIILSKPFPKKKLHATLAKPSDYGAPHTTRKDMHPQISKLNFHDSGNEAKRQFFKGQDPRAVLMIAGFPKQEAMDSPPKRNGRMNANGAEHQVDIFQEESFHSRPAVRIVIPDHLKAILVDDWENVTKSLSLVPLPSAHPVNEILTTYFDEEKGKRRLGSAEADLLEEVVAGVREYFDKCLGRILLYRFEREQFFEIRQTWEGGVGEWEGKGPADVYGAEHLCRLFGTSCLPTLHPHNNNFIHPFPPTG